MSTIRRVVSEVIDSPIILIASDVDMGNVRLFATACKRTLKLFSKLDAKILKEYFPRAGTLARKLAEFTDYRTTPNPKVLAELRQIRKITVAGLSRMIKANKESIKGTKKPLSGFTLKRVKFMEELIFALKSKEQFQDYLRYMKKETKSGNLKSTRRTMKAPPPTKEKVREIRNKRASKTPPKPSVFREPEVPKDTLKAIVLLSKFLSPIAYITRLIKWSDMADNIDPILKNIKKVPTDIKSFDTMDKWWNNNFGSDIPEFDYTMKSAKEFQVPPNGVKNFTNNVIFLVSLSRKILKLNFKLRTMDTKNLARAKKQLSKALPAVSERLITQVQTYLSSQTQNTADRERYS